MKKIRRDDEVIVITGKDKGQRGRVRKVCPDGRLIVTGINMIKKHQKPNPGQGAPGGIIEKEASIQASNVSILNPETNKRDRVGFKINEHGEKQRIFKSDANPIDV